MTALHFGSDSFYSCMIARRSRAIAWMKDMRIPCFGRRITIGRASIVWPGDS